jgi:hypothetical protein
MCWRCKAINKETAMQHEPEVFEVTELDGDAFKSGAVDSLLDQLRANRAMPRIDVALLDDGRIELRFTAQDGNYRIVKAPTVAQAMYSACCVNESLHQCTGADCPEHGEPASERVNDHATATGMYDPEW